MKIFKSIKQIKKTRSDKTCSGCGKDIPVGSSCLQTYELLEIKYSNEYFCDVECIKKRISQFMDMVKFNDEFLKSFIKKENEDKKRFCK